MAKNSNILETKSMVRATTATPAARRIMINQPSGSFAPLAARAGRWLCLLLTASLGFIPINAAEKLSNNDCFDCHLDPTTTRKVEGKTVSLVFQTNAFNRSIHAALDCIDCHVGIKEAVHDAKLPPPDCSSCHEKEAKDYATSIHGVSHKMGASGAANCWDCHGSHDIGPVKSADSPVFKLNLPQTCAKCHSNPGLAQEYDMKRPEAAAQYAESIHGRALLKMGLIVAPSCNDCHGVHDIKRGVDRDAPINHVNIAKTCGKCHVGIEEIYSKSIHGQLLAAGDKRGPVCSDCHT
ncbi:MAG: cytochrome c3 family protein, partial [Akkermansiaceae bacterium]|nr:cytochrome c3 family protein [Verrucomicrobiales bacterium]